MLLNLVLAILAGLHQALAGFSSTAPVVLAGLRFCRPTPNDPTETSLWAAAKAAVGALILVPVVGLAAGLVLFGGDEAYPEMLRRFPQRAYWMAGGELLFTLAVYGIWLAMWRRWREKPARHALLAAVGATNLLYHFPPLMIVQKMLVNRPALSPLATIDRQDFLTLMRTPEVLSRTVHFAGQGTLVSCAVLLALLPVVERSKQSCRLRRVIALFALVALASQVFTGMATLLLMPGGDSALLIGTHWPATLLLAVTLVITLLLLRRWCGVALYPHQDDREGTLVELTLAAVLAMSLASRV